MFDKNKYKSTTDLLGKTNRIVEGTVIKGDITSAADFRLDGQLIGNFKSNGKLVIGPASIVMGDIIAENVDIEGRFEGRIKVSGMLSLKSKAVVKGEVMVGKLSVEPGADFSASCIMKSSVQPPVVPPTSTTENAG